MASAPCAPVKYRTVPYVATTGVPSVKRDSSLCTAAALPATDSIRTVHFAPVKHNATNALMAPTPWWTESAPKRALTTSSLTVCCSAQSAPISFPTAVPVYLEDNAPSVSKGTNFYLESAQNCAKLTNTIDMTRGANHATTQWLTALSVRTGLCVKGVQKASTIRRGAATKTVMLVGSPEMVRV